MEPARKETLAALIGALERSGLFTPSEIEAIGSELAGAGAETPEGVTTRERSSERKEERIGVEV